MPDAATAPTDRTSLEHRLRMLRGIALGSLLVAVAALAVAAIALSRISAADGARATAFAPLAVPVKLDELTLGRLNVVEPDGTPRMIIASRARFPGAPVRGKEIPHPTRNDLAGILFVDDEGTENGGLVQNGQLDASGKVAAGLSLTFDRFRQDQAVQLKLDEDGDEVTAGLVISDVPSYKVFSIDDLLRLAQQTHSMSPAERDAVWQREAANGHTSRRRGYFGIRKGASQLVLSDPRGRPRLTLSVSDRGEPSITLLDEAGKPMRTIDAHTP